MTSRPFPDDEYSHVTFSAFAESLRAWLRESGGPVESAAILSLVEGLSEIEDLAAKHGLDAVTWALAEIVGIERYAASAAGSVVQALSVDIGERLGEEYAFEGTLGDQVARASVADHESSADRDESRDDDSSSLRAVRSDDEEPARRSTDEGSPQSGDLCADQDINHEMPVDISLDEMSLQDRGLESLDVSDLEFHGGSAPAQLHEPHGGAVAPDQGASSSEVPANSELSPSSVAPATFVSRDVVQEQQRSEHSDDGSSVDMRETNTGAWSALRSKLVGAQQWSRPAHGASEPLPQPMAAPRAFEHPFLRAVDVPVGSSETSEASATQASVDSSGVLVDDDGADGFADLSEDAQRFQHLRTEGPQVWAASISDVLMEDDAAAQDRDSREETVARRSQRERPHSGDAPRGMTAPAASSTFQWSDGSDMDLRDALMMQSTQQSFWHAGSDSAARSARPTTPRPGESQPTNAYIRRPVSHEAPADHIAKASSRGNSKDAEMAARLGRAAEPQGDVTEAEKERLWLDDFLIGRNPRPLRPMSGDKPTPLTW